MLIAHWKCLGCSPGALDFPLANVWVDQLLGCIGILTVMCYIVHSEESSCDRELTLATNVVVQRCKVLPKQLN